MTPGEAATIRVQLNDTAYAFLPGHRIRLAVSTTYWPMVWPTPEPVELTLETGASSLTLPVRPPRAGDDGLRLEEEPVQGPPAPFRVLRPAEDARTLVQDAMTGETVVTNRAESGLLYHEGIDLAFGVGGTDTCRIREGDPLSAVGESRRTFEVRRGDWRVRTEGRVTLRCTRDEFLVAADLEAFNGDARAFSRTWNLRIPRDHV